jgi:FixJ family two-component response regulator
MEISLRGVFQHADVLAPRETKNREALDAFTQVHRVLPSFPCMELSHLQRRKSIFVVDDDPSMRRSMKRLLQEHGFEAKLFESAEALVNHDNFQQAFCIILDINLDGESGIDLRRWLAEQQVQVPIVFVTGNDTHESRAAAIASGCIAYLTKPFAAASLIESVERAWGS